MPENRSGKKDAESAVSKQRVTSADQLEHAACCSIIMRVANRGPARRRPDQLPRFFDVIRQTCPAAFGSRLEGILRLNDGYDTCESRAFVYADVIRRGNPVLWPVLAFSAERASHRLKIRAALFYEASGSSSEMGISAVGWRLEPPEDSDGAHSYYHAQPISEWDNSGKQKLPVVDNINEVYPAFPIAAADSISLLAALLVSLYGRVETRNILGDSQLQRYIRPMYRRLGQWL